MIEAKGLCKTYPDGTVALNDVSLAFGDGMLGLLGPNGAGKTTLLSILALAQEPSAGTRSYFGMESRPQNKPQIRRMIGYLAQDFLPMTGLSGIEYLRFCGEMRQVPLRKKDLERRIWALLEAVELTEAAHRMAATYSGGMIRRLGLAQALVHGPKFLIVDEPTAGLDPEERIRFRQLITDLAEEVPVLLSTHIIEDIEATCPRLVIIGQGRLLFDDSPSVLLRRFEGCLWRLPTEAPEPHGALRIGQRAGSGGQVFNVFLAQGQRESSFAGSPLEPTLEEAGAAFLATLKNPQWAAESQSIEDLQSRPRFSSGE